MTTPPPQQRTTSPRIAIFLLIPPLLFGAVALLLFPAQLPGGSLVGGFVAAAIVLLLRAAIGESFGHRLRQVPLFLVVGFGLFLLLLAGSLSLLAGLPWLTGLWQTVPLLGEVGTPFLLHAGAYVTVAGTVIQLTLWPLD